MEILSLKASKSRMKVFKVILSSLLSYPGLNSHDSRCGSEPTGICQWMNQNSEVYVYERSTP